MKTFTKFLTMLAVAALFATGCVNEEPPYKEDPNPEPAGMTGYLSIGNLSMTVAAVDLVHPTGSVTNVKPKSVPTTRRTRRRPHAPHPGRALRLPTWTALSWRSSTPTTRRYSK